MDDRMVDQRPHHAGDCDRGTDTDHPSTRRQLGQVQLFVKPNSRQTHWHFALVSVSSCWLQRTHIPMKVYVFPFAIDGEGVPVPMKALGSVVATLKPRRSILFADVQFDGGPLMRHNHSKHRHLNRAPKNNALGGQLQVGDLIDGCLCTVLSTTPCLCNSQPFYDGEFTPPPSLRALSEQCLRQYQLFLTSVNDRRRYIAICEQRHGIFQQFIVSINAQSPIGTVQHMKCKCIRDGTITCMTFFPPPPGFVENDVFIQALVGLARERPPPRSVRPMPARRVRQALEQQPTTAISHPTPVRMRSPSLEIIESTGLPVLPARLPQGQPSTTRARATLARSPSVEVIDGCVPVTYSSHHWRLASSTVLNRQHTVEVKVHRSPTWIVTIILHARHNGTFCLANHKDILGAPQVGLEMVEPIVLCWAGGFWVPQAWSDILQTRGHYIYRANTGAKLLQLRLPHARTSLGEYCLEAFNLSTFNLCFGVLVHLTITLHVASQHPAFLVFVAIAHYDEPQETQATGHHPPL
ncbi:hypothetical protein FISHEDRAFT_61448 [Fistulina hepatica ATCC 64428]|uniref:Uncharacterized protein n=1 Tax=Fistulina hepatica ATCC 64428 TaxID=1128425 RepID=A0A0D7A251_9AGAR|nr:hypothetical protein FISHEDRAFT_61448 [Fistulina hepatica ATCC 64428]